MKRVKIILCLVYVVSMGMHQSMVKVINKTLYKPSYKISQYLR